MRKIQLRLQMETLEKGNDSVNVTQLKEVRLRLSSRFLVLSFYLTLLLPRRPY